MKTYLNKKLFAFYFLSIFISVTHSQIVYTDIIPDESYGVGDHYIDLNTDGINDFKITFTSGPAAHCLFGLNQTIKITPLNLNSVSKSGSYPAKYNSNVILNETCVWNTAAYQLLRSSTWSGGGAEGSCHQTFAGNFSGEGYLGLKLNVGGNIYYGWARLNIAGAFALSAVLKDYAYNSIPNQPILTGETSCTSPAVSITADGPISFCEGDSVILTATGSGYNYQWKMNGIDITGATTSSYTAKIAGTYKCTVTNSCGSIVSSGKKIKIVCREADENIVGENIETRISPNPFTNSTTITFNLKESEQVTINIYDLNGRLIKTLANQIFNENENAIVWNADDENGNKVSEGIYIVNIKSADLNAVQKLIVSK